MGKEKSRRRWFQFGLIEALLATFFSAIGMAFLLYAEGTIWQFAPMIMLAGASFGASVGTLIARPRDLMIAGMILGALFVLFAAVT